MKNAKQKLLSLLLAAAALIVVAIPVFKVIADPEGKEDTVIMAWWFNRAIMRLTDPEHADEWIAEIEKTCAEYKEPLNV